MMRFSLDSRRLLTVRSLWLSAAVVTLVTARILGQSQSEPFQAGIDLLQLDVTVLDKNRRPVRGLTAADFLVSEDGKPARVVAVQPIDVAPRTVPSTAWMDDIASDVATNDHDVRRIVVILLDDARSGANYSSTSGIFRDPWIMNAGRRIARDVVDSLGPNDLAAVTFTLFGRRQNFTNDRSRLTRALESFVPQDGGAAGAPMACTFRGRSGCVLDAFHNVINSMPSAPVVRKVIVFISQGGGLPGFSADVLAMDASGASNRTPNRETIVEMQSLFRQLQDTHTTVYGFSPGGLQILNSNGMGGVRSIAEATGGRVIADTNMPWAGVPTVLDETSSYYLLGIETAHRDGRFHRIAVSINRPELEARTRVGYFAPLARPDAPGKAGNSPPDESVERTLLGGYPKGDLPLASAIAVFAAGRGRRAQVLTTTSVRSPRSGAGSLEFVAAAFDDVWRKRGQVRQEIEISAAVGAAGIEVQSRFELTPGRYEFRAAAGSRGQFGSLITDFEVPDFASLEVATSTPILILGPSSGEGDSSLPLKPTTRRAFARDQQVTAAMQVYQQKAKSIQPVVVTAAVLDASDNVAAEAVTTINVERFNADKAASFTMALPLSRLQPGEYLLKLAAVRTAHSVTSLIRFIVIE